MPHGSLPTSDLMPVSYMVPMTAGAVAGISEHLVMYPVDTIKTRAQALANCGTGNCGPGVAFSLVSRIICVGSKLLLLQMRKIPEVCVLVSRNATNEHQLFFEFSSVAILHTLYIYI